jgi:hypothetical protein
MNHLLDWVGVHTFVLRFYLFFEIIDSTESQQTESSVTIVNVPTNKGISKDPKYYHGTPLIYKQIRIIMNEWPYNFDILTVKR